MTWYKNSLLLTLLMGYLLMATSAYAGEFLAFDPAKFDAAQKAGRSILIDVHAEWCSTCRRQAPILKNLSNEKRFSDMVFMRVDFDKNKKAVKRFGAYYQSTLVVFKGSNEVGRSVGETNKQRIIELLEKGF